MSISSLLTVDLGYVVKVHRRLWLVDGTGRAVWPMPAGWPTPLHTPVPVVREGDSPMYRPRSEDSAKAEQLARLVLSPSACSLRSRIRPTKQVVEIPQRNIVGEVWQRDADGTLLLVREEYCNGLRLLAKRAKRDGLRYELAQMDVGAIRSFYREPQYQPVILMVAGKPRAVVMPVKWQPKEQ